MPNTDKVIENTFWFKGWAEEFLRLPPHPMSKLAVESMCILHMAEQRGSSMPNEVSETFPFRVTNKRAEAIGLDATPEFLAFLALAICRSPGEVVMFLYVIRFLQVSKRLERVSMESFPFHIFSMGFPSEKDLHRMWQAQKDAKGQNRIDQEINFSLLEGASHA